jgi:hypothetical protein
MSRFFDYIGLGLRPSGVWLKQALLNEPTKTKRNDLVSHSRLSLFWLPSFALINFALDQADIHIMLITWVSLFVCSGLLIDALRRTQWIDRIGWKSKTFISCSLLICLAFGAFGHYLWSHKHESAEQTEKRGRPADTGLKSPAVQQSIVVPVQPQINPVNTVNRRMVNHPSPSHEQPVDNPSTVLLRHILTTEEQGKFEKPLLSQAEDKEQIGIVCPASDEPVCVYAAQFIDIFKQAGFVVSGGVVRRVTLGIPNAGVRLFTYSDYAFDPNQKPGIGHWVQMTPSLINVRQAFANIGIGTDQGSGNELPARTITVYFGPEEQGQTAAASLATSLQQLAAIRAHIPAKVNTQP